MDMDLHAVLPPLRAQEDVCPAEAGDYKDQDGLLVCGVCGGRKQVHIVQEDMGLDFVVPCLCKCKTKERDALIASKENAEKIKRLENIRSASLMSEKFRDASFEAYIHRPENEKAYKVARNYVDKFTTMKENNQGLLFYGSVGTGKSYTSACIANALLDKGTTVVMTSFVKLLQDIQMDKEQEDRYMRIMESVSLLIIDDLGAERNTAYALEKVYNVIDSRVRANLPMILTTNLSINQMKNPESMEYSRIYDRIFEVCYPIHMAGDSMRTQKAKERYYEMAKLIED